MLICLCFQVWPLVGEYDYSWGYDNEREHYDEDE